MYCSKSIEWAQEEEVRFFSNYTHNPYPEKALTGILLGSQSPSRWEDLVHKELSSWVNKPKIYKEDVKKSSIKMYFKLLN